SVYKRSFLLFFRNRCQTSFEIVYNRKNLFDHFSGSYLIHRSFFLLCTFPVIIKLRHLSFYHIGKFFYFFIFFVFFLLEKAFYLRLLLFILFFSSVRVFFLSFFFDFFLSSFFGCFFIILFYDFFRLTLRNCFFVYGIEFSLFFCHEFLPPFYVFFLNILSN